MKKCSGLGMLELMITIAVAGIALVPLIGIIADISSENTLSREELLAVHQADTVFQIISCLPFEKLSTGVFTIEKGPSAKNSPEHRSTANTFEAILRNGVSDSAFFMHVNIEKQTDRAVFTVTLDSSENPGLKRPVTLEGCVFRELDFFERAGQ